LTFKFHVLSTISIEPILKKGRKMW